MEKPGLFGITHSNRDFSLKETWGKNQFNSSFPAALLAYLDSKSIKSVYLFLDENLKVKHGVIGADEILGLSPSSENLYYAFESIYSPYQQILTGNLPRVDLVTQNRENGQVLRPIEIKLTALPDNSTCNLDNERFGTEIVVRPDTIVYLVCSIAINFKENSNDLRSLIGNKFDDILDWSEGYEVWDYIPEMIIAIDKVISSLVDKQIPLLMQPIWKTEGKSPSLADNCLDVFVWSNFAFVQLFIDVARKDFRTENKITRQTRTIIWLFKMLLDFANDGRIDHKKIIDELSYNTKNDKAFAVSGRITQPYMKCAELSSPRIRKSEVRNIILGGGQNLLSPERRFDAIIYNTPELFS